jgi:2-polyprenyl-6-methoxyphenol hydroxylase-like FAD-dependent oxidoreductase
MNNRNILISGASIAGPALAYWLRRYGFNPTVVERAPALREGGYKVDIRGAAVDVAERMGILEEVRRASTDMRGASFVNRDGKRLATMDADLFGGRAGEDVEIMRGDLTRILYEATRQDIEYIFNDSITTITQDEAGVEVTFTHGQPRSFDLVVGADGLHSNVRALAFGDESQFIRHLGHYIAIFTIPNELQLDRGELIYAIPGKTTNVYSTRQATNAKALFLFAAPLHYDRRDTQQQKQILAETFAGAGWEVPRLLEHMAETPDFYFDSISQIHMAQWSNGRVVLTGDASYGPSPASGQGTSLALVGAYVLAGELAAAAGNHRTAFMRYEKEMREYVEQNQRLAPMNLRGMVLQSRSQIWFQTQMVRILPYLPGKNRIIGRITQAIHQAATAITLKDYGADARGSGVSPADVRLPSGREDRRGEYGSAHSTQPGDSGDGMLRSRKHIAG